MRQLAIDRPHKGDLKQTTPGQQWRRDLVALMIGGYKLYGFGDENDGTALRGVAGREASIDFSLSSVQRGAIRDALGADIDPGLARRRDAVEDVAASSSWTLRLLTALWHIENLCERCQAYWQTAAVQDRHIVRLLRSTAGAARRVAVRAQYGSALVRRRSGSGVLPRLFDS